MTLRFLLAPLALAMTLGACCTKAADDAAHSTYPEARPYVRLLDAGGASDAALARAAETDRRMLLIMGANWCHDSRSLAGWLSTERFGSLIADHYELVYVNIGHPQEGEGVNLDIAQRFGIEDVPGTPNPLVVTPEGLLVNPVTATTWRNAASRSEDDIYAELVELAHRPAPVGIADDAQGVASSDIGQ